MEVALALMLHLCIIGFVVTAQESKETLVYHGDGSKAPNISSDGYGFASSPAVPNGPFFQPPTTFLPPTAAPTPQKIKAIAPFNSPSPIITALSPPYEVVPSPSAFQANKPPSVKSSPPPMKVPSVMPPVSTPTAPAPVAVSPGRSPKTSPVSQPAEHGNLAPNFDSRNANGSHLAEPFSPSPGAVPSANLPQNSSGSQPAERGPFPPNEGINKGHNPESISPGM